MAMDNFASEEDAASESAQIQKSLNSPVVRRIHRRAPFIKVSSFIFGVIGAISHHVFYSMMNGRAVETNFQQN